MNDAHFPRDAGAPDFAPMDDDKAFFEQSSGLQILPFKVNVSGFHDKLFRPAAPH